MLSDATAARLAALIDPDRAMDLPVAPRTEAIHRDTVYLTVVDRDRMVVSMIYSIFHAFGAGLASDKFGILFQNREVTGPLVYAGGRVTNVDHCLFGGGPGFVARLDPKGQERPESGRS
jgi:hypothetical protein